MGIIKLSELTFFTTLGIHKTEQENPIEIKVSIEIKTAKIDKTKYKKNKIITGIDYVELYEKVQNIVENQHHFLVEELVKKINEQLADWIKDFEYIKTRVIKPNPLVFSKGGVFEVEITFYKKT